MGYQEVYIISWNANKNTDIIKLILVCIGLEMISCGETILQVMNILLYGNNIYIHEQNYIIVERSFVYTKTHDIITCALYLFDTNQT